MESLLERTLRNLTLQPPKTAAAGEQMDRIREAAKAFAISLCLNAPESRELSLAITHLEEATQWAIAAVARNQEQS